MFEKNHAKIVDFAEIHNEFIMIKQQMFSSSENKQNFNVVLGFTQQIKTINIQWIILFTLKLKKTRNKLIKWKSKFQIKKSKSRSTCVLKILCMGPVKSSQM